MSDLTVDELWAQRVGAFAVKVGKTEEEITAALESVIGPKGEAALEVLADPEASPFEDLKGVLTSDPVKIPIGVLRKNVGLLRGPQTEAIPVSATAASDAAFTGIATEVLPVVMDDESFVAALKVGGDLKVGPLDVLAAVRSALADQVGLFYVPEILKNRMEAFAESNDEPVGKAFVDLRNIVVKRKYSEVLSVLGIEGSFITESRKNKFLAGLRDGLWQEINAFHQQLVGWQRNWMDSTGNPGILVAAIVSGMGGGAGAIPPGMMQAPETDTVRDQAEAVINRINKVFAGFGIPVARALAYDAQQIKTVLSNEGLPATIGATNREQMLKMIGVDVANDYVRLERNIVRYILAIMELPKVTSGQSEINFLGAMLQLGNSIPWAKLMTEKGKISAPGKRMRGVGDLSDGNE